LLNQEQEPPNKIGYISANREAAYRHTWQPTLIANTFLLEITQIRDLIRMLLALRSCLGFLTLRNRDLSPFPSRMSKCVIVEPSPMQLNSESETSRQKRQGTTANCPTLNFSLSENILLVGNTFFQKIQTMGLKIYRYGGGNLWTKLKFRAS